MVDSAFCAKKSVPRTNPLCPPDQEVSNIGAIGFIDADVAIPTLTTAADFYTFLKAQVLLCKARIIADLVGAHAAASAIRTGKNYGNRTQPKIVSKDHAITGFDQYHLTNTEWWNAMEEDSSDQNFFFVTNNYIFIVIGAEVDVEFNTLITDTGKDEIDGAFTIAWNQKGSPVPQYLSGIRKKINGKTNVIAHTVVIGALTGATTSAGNVINVATTAAASVNFDISEEADTAQPLKWALSASIPGLTLNTTTGVLAGTATSAGTYQRFITMTNACGVPGAIAITVIVS